MPTPVILYPRHDAPGEAGRLRNAVPARFAMGQALPHTAEVAAIAQQSATARVMEALAAIALAVGGYMR